tara:strand:+ start:369 stop:1076 length:708 start_codon:yes stop_codon:yes gene_type:complete
MDIKNLSLLKDGSETFLTALGKQAHVLKCEKGKILFLHEDTAEYFYIVKSGWIKLFRETLDGTQSVNDILGKGNAFGETALFENNVYPYSAEAVEASEIISLPLKLLKEELEHNNKFSMHVMRHMAHQRHQKDMEIEHRDLQNAPQRIGCFLLNLIDRDAHGAAKIDLPYDKTLIASKLGMQPETFSRALSKLKEKTGIHIKGSHIELYDPKQLIEYCCSHCSSEFPCKDLLAQK